MKNRAYRFLHMFLGTNLLRASIVGTAMCGLLTGCSREPRPLQFDPNLVHAKKYEIKDGVPMDQAAEDAFWVVSEMFGTPEEPKLPAIVGEDEELASLVSMDNLIKASGYADTEGRGLYQKHCVTCHGTSGSGRGPLAIAGNPYPRDYRKGVFKFKSTERGEKPLKEDMAVLIKHGIAGSPMVAIESLTDEDVDALVDYVIYLSWRGEVERMLVEDAFYELDLEQGDRIINPMGKFAIDEDAKEAFEDAWELAEGFVEDVGVAWLEAPEAVVEVPEPPADFIVPDSYEEFVEISKGEDAEKLLASVERGRELFRGKIAACSKCHGENGLGDGQNTDYDDWTKDWTVGIGVDPKDTEKLLPLMARGALPPLNAQPRNFKEGLFRGGSKAADLYRRITQGIEGSPMPAVTYVDGEFEEDDVWHLINFVRSLNGAGETESKPDTDATGPAASATASLEINAGIRTEVSNDADIDG